MRWFISSVTADMQQHRNAVANAMRYLRERSGLDFVPFRMEEDYPSPSTRPDLSYLEELDRSDAVALIVGKCYGNKNSDDGLSATHRELLRAVQNGKLIVLFYDKNTDEYEPEESEFLHIAFTHAQGYAYDGTHQNLETVAQRVLEGVYRGSVDRNPSVTHISGLDFAEERQLTHVAVLSAKLSTPISIDRALERHMETSLSWLDMVSLHINQPRLNEVARHYYQTTCSTLDEEFTSMGRLYDNGEVLLITIQPFLSSHGLPPKTSYSRLLNAVYLQTKIAEFVKFVVALAQDRHAKGPIQLRLTLRSNQPMQLKLVNQYLQMNRAIMGQQSSIESEHAVEDFLWEIQSSDEETIALEKTRDQLLSVLYRSFHYSEPELFPPFV